MTGPQAWDKLFELLKKREGGFSDKPSVLVIGFGVKYDLAKTAMSDMPIGIPKSIAEKIRGNDFVSLQAWLLKQGITWEEVQSEDPDYIDLIAND